MRTDRIFRLVQTMLMVFTGLMLAVLFLGLLLGCCVLTSFPVWQPLLPTPGPVVVPYGWTPPPPPPSPLQTATPLPY